MTDRKNVQVPSELVALSVCQLNFRFEIRDLGFLVCRGLSGFVVCWDFGGCSLLTKIKCTTCRTAVDKSNQFSSYYVF